MKSTFATWLWIAGSVVISFELSGATVTTDYTYDAAGRLARAAYSSGSAIAYAYDPAGNLSGLHVAPANDTDHDDLDDAWEVTNFGSLVRDGSGDADGDGQSDLAEYLAGTDPNVGDVPKITLAATVTEARVSLTWNGVAGRTYRAQFKNTLDGPWQDLSGDITAAGGTAGKVDDVGVLRPARFYRVLLLP